MLKGYRFHFRPVLTAFALLALGVLIALGTWQLKRLEWKRDLIAKVEARVEADPIPFEEALARAEAGEDMEYTPVKINGDVRTCQYVRVFGTYNGSPGAYHFELLESDAGKLLYVNVGFLSLAQARIIDFCLERAEPAQIAGLFRYRESLTPPSSWFRPQEKSADGLWFVRDPLAFAADAGVDALPYYVDQFAVPGREWPKGGTTRLDFNNRHLEYALTWFGLALTLVGVWIAFSLQKR